jgi:hypothetical protein
MQVLQRHLVAGTLFSLGINNDDIHHSLLGNDPEDDLKFTVSISCQPRGNRKNIT